MNKENPVIDTSNKVQGTMKDFMSEIILEPMEGLIEKSVKNQENIFKDHIYEVEDMLEEEVKEHFDEKINSQNLTIRNSLNSFKSEIKKEVKANREELKAIKKKVNLFMQYQEDLKKKNYRSLRNDMVIQLGVGILIILMVINLFL